VENIEKASNSQLARDIEIALPIELTYMQNLNLIREYVKYNFVDKGMCADICIHDTGAGNPHAHIMLTMRPFNKNKTWGEKSKKEYILNEHGEKIRLISGEFKSRKISTVDWNEQTKAEEWRMAWAYTVNRYLENSNHTERIDHRSYERQGIEQIPTVHLGVAAHQMEQRGIATELGNVNREIDLTNKHIQQLRARINKLQKWIDEATANTEPPTLVEIIHNILSRQKQNEIRSNYSTINSLKSASKLLLFLQENQITDMAGLKNKVSELLKHQVGIRNKLKPIERRLNVLHEHIKQAEFYHKYSEMHKIYKQQPTKKQEAFFEANRAELMLYQSAERYFKEHLNGRNKIPLTSWQNELIKLNSDKSKLYHEYNSLKEQVKEVEQIKRQIESILCEEMPKISGTRVQKTHLPRY